MIKKSIGRGWANKRVFRVTLAGVEINLLATQVANQWVLTMLGSSSVWSEVLFDNELDQYLAIYGGAEELDGNQWVAVKPRSVKEAIYG